MENLLSNHFALLGIILVAIVCFTFILKAKFNTSYIIKNAILIGLTGTFLGITIALFLTKFDSLSVEIKPLFTGLQVATLTTLLGLLCYLYAGKGESADNNEINDNLILNLINALSESKNQQKALNENLYKFLLLQEKNYSIHLSNEELIAILKKAAEQLAIDLRQINNETANTLKMTLNDMLKELGDGLTNLSGKFVADYKPLTEKLQALVMIAETLHEPTITKVVDKK